MEKKQKQCDICKAKEATSLCPQCFSYYCDKCFKCVHEEDKNKAHKKEKIDYFVPIDTRCPEHEGDNISLFCVDEKGIYIFLFFLYRIMLCLLLLYEYS